MKFNKPEKSFPKVLQNGFKIPTHYLLFGDKKEEEINTIDLINSVCNTFIGRRKNIEKLIKQIIAHKSNSKEDYNDAEYFLVSLWDKNIKKEMNDILMLATFESVDNLTIKLPLDHYFNISKDILTLTTDNCLYTCPLMVLDNFYTKQKENKVNNKITDEEYSEIEKVLKNNITEEVFHDFKVFEFQNEESAVQKPAFKL